MPTYLAILEHDGNAYGGWFADLPINATGTTPDEVRQRLREGLALYLHDLHQEQQAPPEPAARTLTDVDLTDVGEDAGNLTAELLDPAEMNPVSLEIERAMHEAGIATQTQLAAALGVSRQAAARLIDPFYWGHSLTTLRRVAEVLDASVEVRFTRAS